MIAQADEDGGKARRILALYDRMKQQVAELTHSQFASRTLDGAVPSSNLLVAAIHHALRRFEAERGTDSRRVSGPRHLAGDPPWPERRPAIYAFPELLEIVNAAPAEAPPRVEATVHTLDVADHR